MNYFEFLPWSISIAPLSSFSTLWCNLGKFQTFQKVKRFTRLQRRSCSMDHMWPLSPWFRFNLRLLFGELERHFSRTSKLFFSGVAAPFAKVFPFWTNDCAATGKPPFIANNLLHLRPSPDNGSPSPLKNWTDLCKWLLGKASWRSERGRKLGGKRLKHFKWFRIIVRPSRVPDFRPRWFHSVVGVGHLPRKVLSFLAQITKQWYLSPFGGRGGGASAKTFVCFSGHWMLHPAVVRVGLTFVHLPEMSTGSWK